MTEIKQTAESPQAVPVERPAETDSPAEPAHIPVERVTEKRAKDPKKVAAGRAALPPGKKRLLELLHAAKESLRPLVSAADNDGTSAPPNEAKPQKRTDERPAHNHNWVPWIIGDCLARGFTCVYLCGRSPRKHIYARQSVVAGPAPKVQDKPPQLKACPDPHYME